MVRVDTTDDQSYDFETATAWHIDGTQMLHLKDAAGKQVASFADGKWIGVLVLRETAGPFSE